MDLPAQKDPGIFFQYGALAGDDGLGNEQIICRREPDICRHPIACVQAYLVPHCQLGGRDVLPASVSADQHRGGNHPRKMIRHVFCPELLHKTHQAADQQHT